MTNNKLNDYMGMASGFSKMKGRNFREYGCFFQDFDSKEDLDKIMKYIESDKFLNWIILDSGNGIWVLSLNNWELKYRLLIKEKLSKFKGFDWMHWAWEIRKGNTVIRISRKKRNNKIKLLYFNIGILPISKPHWEIFKKLCPEIKNYPEIKPTFFDNGIRIIIYKSRG